MGLPQQSRSIETLGMPLLLCNVRKAQGTFCEIRGLTKANFKMLISALH
jgi:hypothetical protein